MGNLGMCHLAFCMLAQHACLEVLLKLPQGFLSPGRNRLFATARNLLSYVDAICFYVFSDEDVRRGPYPGLYNII